MARSIALDETREILASVGLLEKADATSGALSHGDQKVLEIAIALGNRPELLILDEPTAGVDVELRREMWEVIGRLKAQGVTIILTTHYLEEAESLCRHVAIIDEGRIIALDTIKNLIAMLGGGVIKVGEDVEIVGIRATNKTVCTGVEMFRKLLDEGRAGDNVGVLLAEEPHRQDEMVLLVDVGTNAEIVLSSPEWMYSASSPTGPAFEGGQISSGMRAAPGAGLITQQPCSRARPACLPMISYAGGCQCHWSPRTKSSFWTINA